MIELAFNESAAGALKMAKSMKQGEILQGAVAVFGGTIEERRKAKKPHAWTGIMMKGTSKDVAALTIALDIGDILDIETSIDGRKRLLDDLFFEYPGVTDEIWKTNQHTLARLQAAKETLEPVRMWIRENDPAELCGLYFICREMADTQTPLLVVCVPAEIENDCSIVNYRNTGDINSEDLGKYTGYEKTVSALQRSVFAQRWKKLVCENAPLRAVVNGTLMSVQEDFYDFALRTNMPEGQFNIAHLIGNTLNNMPSIGDQWLYQRIQAMLQSGELVMVSAAIGDHHYSAVVKRYNENAD